jgi:nitrogen fixation NifU-like protein
MDDLYTRSKIVEHIKNPQNFGKIICPTKQVDMVNRSCGDELVLYVKLKKGIIEDIKYSGEACGVAIASASMVTLELVGKPFKELENLTKDQVILNFGKNALKTSRKQCALLIYEGIQEIIKP